MTTLSHIGAKLQAIRTGQRLPKTKVAEMAGISRNTLQQLEAGLGNVELKTLLAVCDALGLDITFAPKAISSKLDSFQADPIPDKASSPRGNSFMSRLVRDKEQLATRSADQPSKAGTKISKKT